MKRNFKWMNHIVNIWTGILIFLIGYDSELVIFTTICSLIVIIGSLFALLYEWRQSKHD